MLVSVCMFIRASVGVSDVSVGVLSSVCVCVLSCVVCVCVLFYHVCLCVQGMFVYYLLGLIWVTQFIIGCERLTISGAVALWFFTR